METRTFAFRLAERENTATTDAAQAPWAIRDGVAIAGCTYVKKADDYRATTVWGGENGIWC